jgi:hypothetical protein
MNDIFFELGHLGSALGYFGSGALGLSGSWALRLLGSWAFGRLGCWTLGLLGCWILGAWAVGYLGTWVPGHCTRALLHLGYWALGSANFKYRFSIPMCKNQFKIL